MVGTFAWPMRISSMDGGRSRDLEPVVDTGAAFTTVPARLLRELGIEPKGRRRFVLADGRRIFMDYGDARVTIDGEEVITLVVFGEDGGPPLLGAYTLEGLALAVDPEQRRLVPTTMFLCRSGVPTGHRASSNCTSTPVLGSSAMRACSLAGPGLA